MVHKHPRAKYRVPERLQDDTHCEVCLLKKATIVKVCLLKKAMNIGSTCSWNTISV
jgi:hypothetical protein